MSIHDVEKSSSDTQVPEQSGNRNAPPIGVDNYDTNDTKHAAAPPTPGRTDTTAATDHPPVIPDGGFIAWCQVLGSFFLNFNSWGIALSYGVYQTYYTPWLASEASPSDISWVGSIQVFLLVPVGVITGPLYDHGYFRALISVGSFLVVFGMMMTSLCTQYWQIVLAQGLVVGLGTGCLFVPGVAILPTYFSSRKALAQGLASTGSSLGGVIYPIVFRQLQPRIGFAPATRAIGYITMATLVVPLAIMRMRIKPPGIRKLVDVSAWKEPAYALFSLGQFFDFMGMYIPYIYVQSYAIEKHITNTNVGFYILAILNAGSVFGRIIPNFMADKTGPLNMLVPTCAITSLLVFAWIATDTPAGLIIFASLFGFFSGTFVSLPPTAVVTLSPSLAVVGVRLGMTFFLTSLGLLIGAPICGAILKQSWVGLQVWGGACIAIATACMVGARVAKAGWGLTTKA